MVTSIILAFVRFLRALLLVSPGIFSTEHVGAVRARQQLTLADVIMLLHLSPDFVLFAVLALDYSELAALYMTLEGLMSEHFLASHVLAGELEQLQHREEDGLSFYCFQLG